VSHSKIHSTTNLHALTLFTFKNPMNDINQTKILTKHIKVSKMTLVPRPRNIGTGMTSKKAYPSQETTSGAKFPSQLPL